MTGQGDLVIEGQDLGPAVEGFWGGSEYEWIISIRAEDVPTYLRALGGHGDTHDPLEFLSARYREDARCVSKSFLDGHGIPCQFWSRVGE